VLAPDHAVAVAIDPAHGAPLRLVSPAQYGYMSIKHLTRITLHAKKPRKRGLLALLLPSHSRGRIWQEERHPWVPSAAVGPLYRAIMRAAARRGGWTFRSDADTAGEHDGR
jgi:DMSO/TMAO reductase YedYZ molybdopterin-dependent catalytic subunit